MQSNELNAKRPLRSAHTCRIGKVFQKRRQLLALTESEVSSKLYVNVNYIKGIEHGDYSIFPARIFAIQYFRKYADFLELKLNFCDVYDSKKSS